MSIKYCYIERNEMVWSVMAMLEFGSAMQLASSGISNALQDARVRHEGQPDRTFEMRGKHVGGIGLRKLVSRSTCAIRSPCQGGANAAHLTRRGNALAGRPAE